MKDAVGTIDVDEPGTWPDATRQWVDERARTLAGSTEYTSDLSNRLLEEEDDLRATFTGLKLLAYHCTRLLPHEVEAIRTDGLRLLDRALVHDRVAAGVAQASLSPAVRAHAEQSNVYAVDNITGREGQICFVLGRSTFDEDAGGCFPLLAHWGGEAMRGGPDDAPLLAGIGTPSIVLTRLNLTTSWRHSTTHPALTKMFVGTLLGTERRCAEVFYRDPVPPEDVLAIWQPGESEYDQHTGLPR